jgi:uncharacterized membrane protein YeaQ/YmgE (transglycosylase-associated protein family)
MTIGGLAAAAVLGAVIGVLGKLLMPARPGMPLWLLMATGVVAAFAGTGLAQVFELGNGGWSPWETVLQALLAVAGVGLAEVFWPKRSDR